MVTSDTFIWQPIELHQKVHWKLLGVEVRFCDLTCPEESNRLMEILCALFLEVITNPQLEVADLKALADIAHKAGVPLLADTTAIPFHVFHATDFGVDIEIVSSTKYISGGATCIGRTDYRLRHF